MTRRGLSITDLADMARAFADKPRKPRRNGWRRGARIPNPRPKSLEPVQGELLRSPETEKGAVK